MFCKLLTLFLWTFTTVFGFAKELHQPAGNVRGVEARPSVRGVVTKYWNDPAFHVSVSGNIDVNDSEYVNNTLILKPGFSDYDREVLLNVARSNPGVWLTDFVPPSLRSAIVLNIAAKLLVEYKVDPDDVPYLARQLSEKVPNLSSSFLQKMKDSPCLYCSLLDKLKHEKSITNEFVGEWLDFNFDQLLFAASISLQKKPVHKENKDLVVLGSAGSGKSTIVKGLREVDGSFVDQSNYIALGTDYYRGVNPTNVDLKSFNDGKNYVRTQDTAFMVKELVRSRIMALNSRGTGRASILLDGIRVTSEDQEVINLNPNLVRVIMAALPYGHVVPERALKRGLNPEASLGDFNRLVNTKFLLSGHQSQAAGFLNRGSLPYGVVMDIYNTAVPWGSSPTLMAQVDTIGINRTLNVFDLEKFSQFTVKSAMNVGALSVADLYSKNVVDNLIPGNRLLSQAYSIFQLLYPNLGHHLKPYEKKDAFSLELKDPKTWLPYFKVNAVQAQSTNIPTFDLQVVDQKNFMRSATPILKYLVVILDFYKNSGFVSLSQINEKLKIYGLSNLFNSALKKSHNPENRDYGLPGNDMLLKRLPA